MKPELGDAVRILKPYSFPYVYHLVRLQESYFIKQKSSILQSCQNLTRIPLPPQPYTYAKTVTIHATHLSKYGPNAVNDKPKRRRLTPVELREKRAKGLCYVCDEIILEELEKELFKAKEVAESCEISIHALHAPGTIKP